MFIAVPRAYISIMWVQIHDVLLCYMESYEDSRNIFFHEVNAYTHMSYLINASMWFNTDPNNIYIILVNPNT